MGFDMLDFDTMLGILFQSFVAFGALWWFISMITTASCDSIGKNPGAWACPSIAAPTWIIQFNVVIRRRKRCCFKERGERFSFHEEVLIADENRTENRSHVAASVGPGSGGIPTYDTDGNMVASGSPN